MFRGGFVTVIKFEKYQGLGNDFVVLDERGSDRAPDLDAAVLTRLCDRHFGIGADGVLEVRSPRSEGADATMIVRNADGSRPEMCGNGLRCVAAHVARERGGEGVCRVVVDTDAGPRACEVQGDDVTVDMGRGVALGPIEVETEGRTFVFERVSMGNPHAVSFAPYTRAEFERHGLALATHPAFPQGTNVELCHQRSDGSIEVLVWERGVGPTLACGSGACAVAVRAVLDGLAAFDEPVAVHLPGGTLHITVTRDLGVHMRGPARRVFVGEVFA